MTLLLESKVDMYAETFEGLSALGVAAKMGSLTSAKILLDWHRRTGRQKPFKGSCIDHRSRRDEDSRRSQGRTLLHLAVESDDVTVARTLIDNGADVEADIDGNAPLNLALIVKSYAVARCLIYSGANVNRRSAKDNFTPLHQVADDCQPRLVRLLLERGAEVNAVAAYNETPLHIAAKNFFLSEAAQWCCKILIDGGADLEAKNDFGLAPGDFDYIRSLRDVKPELFKPIKFGFN